MKKFLFFSFCFCAVIPSFAVWDKTVPLGTEAKSLGDDRIREMKSDLEDALQFEGDFPGTDTSNPRFIYTPSTGTTADRPTGNDAPAGRLFFNLSSGTIEMSQGNGSWNALTVVGSSQIAASMLSSDLAGAGLAGEGGVPLRVNADSNTFTITNDTVTILANSIGSAQLADAVSFPTSVNSSTYTLANFGILPILQIQYQETDSKVNITSASFANSASLVTITPKRSTSKILILTSGTGLQNAGDAGAFTIARDGSNLGPANGLAAVNASQANSVTMMVYDSPGDTSAHTYRVQMKSNAASASTEYPYQASGGQTRATIMAVEIAQ